MNKVIIETTNHDDAAVRRALPDHVLLIVTDEQLVAYGASPEAIKQALEAAKINAFCSEVAL